MRIQDYRDEFQLWVIHQDPVGGARWCETLSAAGYQPELLTDIRVAIHRLTDELPHVILLDLEPSGLKSAEFQKFAKKVSATSDEILLVPAVIKEDVPYLLQNRASVPFYDYVLKPWTSALEFVHRIDSVCEKHIVVFGEDEGDEDSDNIAPTGDLKASKTADPQGISLKDLHSLKSLVTQLESAPEADHLTRRYLEFSSQLLNQAPGIFLKFIPSPPSFVLYQGQWIEIEQYRGLGVQIPKRIKDIKRLMVEKLWENHVREFVKKVFKQDNCYIQYLEVAKEPKGMFIFFDSVEDQGKRDAMTIALSFLASCYANIDMQLRQHQLDIYDAHTAVYNKRYMQELIEVEIVRARRTRLPVALLFAEIDQSALLKSRLSPFEYQKFMKQVAKLLSRTSRNHDFWGRWNESTFVCLLPHTPIEGAAKKAERLRSIFENAKFKKYIDQGLEQITLSIGLSEYPSFCVDSESLLRSADEALSPLKSAGGNKVCVTQKPNGFTPDFEPAEMASFPKL